MLDDALRMVLQTNRARERGGFKVPFKAPREKGGAGGGGKREGMGSASSSFRDDPLGVGGVGGMAGLAGLGRGVGDFIPIGGSSSRDLEEKRRLRSSFLVTKGEKDRERERKGDKGDKGREMLKGVNIGGEWADGREGLRESFQRVRERKKRCVSTYVTDTS